MPVPEPELEDIKRQVNATIHELVFVCHHADNDAVEDAMNCLMTAQGTLDAVAARMIPYSEE